MGRKRLSEISSALLKPSGRSDGGLGHGFERYGRVPEEQFTGLRRVEVPVQQVFPHIGGQMSTALVQIGV